MLRTGLSTEKMNMELRLFHKSGVGQNEIAGAVDLARSTVQKYIQRVSDAGITWSLPEGKNADLHKCHAIPHVLRHPSKT